MQKGMAIVERAEHSANVRVISEILLNNRHMAQSVLSFIEFGCFGDPMHRDGGRATPRRKWRHMSCSVVKLILKAAFPDHTEQIDNLKDNKQMLLHMLLFLYDIDLDDHYSPDQLEVPQRRKRRSFEDLRFHSGEVDWKASGVFSVDFKDGVNYLHHNDSGQVMKLPSLLQDMHVAVDMNYSEDSAVIQGADGIENKCKALMTLDQD